MNAGADLYGFDRLDGHDRLRQAGIQLCVPVPVASQARRQSCRHHLKRATDGIGIGRHLVNDGDHLPLQVTVRHLQG